MIMLQGKKKIKLITLIPFSSTVPKITEFFHISKTLGQIAQKLKQDKGNLAECNQKQERRLITDTIFRVMSTLSKFK